MAKSGTVFYCSDCGNETLKWQGRCPACGAWNTITEHTAPKKSAAKSGPAPARGTRAAVRLEEIDTGREIRFSTGMSEFDRVLGGGAVVGSLVLVGGAPGIGKSTLLLQICSEISRKAKVLYVTGEESERQIKLRAERLGAGGDGIYILAETGFGNVLESIETLNPDILIVDSIQTLYNEELDASPGSVTQVKNCTMSLMQLAKSGGITVFVIGHVNKEGAIAGPKVLEHMVDCVLYFEGDGGLSHRILRAAKNRFGSTNEIGVFEMLENGLSPVENPSEMLLSGRPKNSPGTCVSCIMEGSRPILAEVQALVTPASSGAPRRNTSGFDFNRALMLLAVLEKRGGIKLSGCDAYINVIGGLTLDEPAADLATMLALASSARDMPVGDELAAIGELGLTGELRSVNSAELRLSEIRRLGFNRCVLPAQNAKKLTPPEGLKLIAVQNIGEAFRAVFG